MTEWMPTTANINALPLGIKNYIHDLSTLCDPAGIIAENTLLKDEVRMIAKVKGIETEMSNALNETFAKQAHERWCHWMKYLFSKCIVNIDGSVTIPIVLTERWIRQMNTAYSELPEAEKMSDLKEAIRFVELLKMIGLLKDEK